jgi:hypothetical protein
MSEGQIFNILVEFFEEDNWDFHWLEGMPILSMGFTGKNGKWTCYAQAREEQEQFVFYSVCPINVPEERRQKAAEFITRANYGMIIGNFELDFNDGEVRYKTSIDVEGSILSPPLIKQMVYSNVIIMDRYLPGVMRVIYGDGTPLEEIGRIEGSALSAPPPAFDQDDIDLDEDDFIDDDDDDFDEDDGDDDEYPPNGMNGTSGSSHDS